MSRRGVATLAALVWVLCISAAARAAERSAASATGAPYFTITPCRLIDTRTGFGGGPTLAGGETRIIAVTGFCAVPSNARSVALNVIVVNPVAVGNARLFPGDAAKPLTSTLNFSPGQIRANNAIVPLAGNGSGTVALLNSSLGGADYVIDLVGYFGCSSIIVSPPGPALPAGTSGTSYSQTFTASGGSGSYTFAITSGTQPAGLNLSSAGVLSGTPTEAGDFSFTVTATDAVTGCVGATAYTLHVACGTLTVSITPTPAQVCAGSAGNGASATAGFPTYAWTISNGTIVGPTNTQSITYTAGASGSVGLTVNVTDASACPGQAMASVPINAVPATPSILTANPQTFTVSGLSGSFTLTFNGQTTSSLAFNATAAEVQGALNALSSIGGAGGTVGVTQAGSLYTVTFGGALSGPQPMLTASAGGGCTVVINPFSVCAGSAGNLASGPAGAATYAWTITNGTITSATDIQTITYTAGATGPITLTLTVTNGAGCAASNNAQVVVNPTPATPTITPTPAQVCAGSAGNTADGPAGAATYAWTITNGTITSAADVQTITYTAGTSGNVQLDLTVTNASGCSASNSIQVPINAVPAPPTITPTPAQVCAGSTGNQASGPAGATTYAWSITNGTITSATDIQTITYTAGPSGNVQLDLTVSNGAACGAANSILVPINDLPATPSIATSNPQSFTVSGASGTFTLTFTGQTTASLPFDATAAQVQSALNALSSIGGAGGTVAVTFTGGVYTVTFGGTLTGPQPQMTASGAGGCTVIVTPPAVCADSTGNLATGPAGATTYAWTVTNGTITSATDVQTITYDAGSSGTVTLGLTVTNAAACAASNSVDLTVNANPATPTITPTPAQVCGNSTGNTADGPAGATTYAWTITNGTITSATNIQTITYTAGASGVVTLHLTVTNDSGCSASNSQDVTINAAPATPTITPSPAQVCTGVAGNQASGPAGATTYAWTIVNGTITSAANIQTITYTAGASGNVGLTLTVTNAQGCSASNNVNVPINAAPTLAPSAGALTAGTFSVAYSQTFTPSPAGTYTFSISPAAPFGLTFNASTGVLSGTPNNTGLNSGFSITATNSTTGCSVTQAYTLTVRPKAAAETFNGIVGNTQLVLAAACPSGLATPYVCQTGTVLANDAGPAALAACTGACPVALATTGGGTVSMNANGTFTYTPAVGFTGPDTFTYTLTDGNGVTNAATDTINVLNRVWYVRGSGGAGDGRSQSPFNSLVAASSAHAAGDVIFVESGGAPTATPGAITLKANVFLWGQGTSLPAIGGVTILNTGATTKPVLSGTVTVGGSGDTISSLDVNTGASTGITGSGALGTLTIENAATATTSSGTAFSLSNASGTVNADATTAFTTGNGTAFSADQGTANINLAGSISSGGSGRSVSVTNRTGGTATFSGAVSDNGTGIFLNNNTGSSNAFTGGLNISTGTNAAFTATGGGAVTATQNNTSIQNKLKTTTGTALNVANTTIGAAGLTFRSIDSNGGSNGIVLNNTGASGSLVVTGNAGPCTNAGNCSGGAIQNKTVAISLTSTTAPSFDRMFIQNTTQSGISGTQVAGFTLINSVVDSSGSAGAPVDNRSNLGFGFQSALTENNLSGVVTITGNTLTNAYEHGIDIQNFSGTITNATITGNTITSSTAAAASHGSGIRLLGFGSAGGVSNVTTATISGNTITNFPGGAGITAQFGNAVSGGPAGIWGTPGSPTNRITISGNLIAGQSAANPMGANAILMTLTGAGQANWLANGNGTAANPIANIAGTEIGVTVRGPSPTATCDITNNRIQGITSVGAQAIVFAADYQINPGEAPLLTGTISGNVVSGQDGEGITVLATSQSAAVVKATVANNTIAAPNCSGCNRFGMTINSGLSNITTGGNPSVCVKLTGNTSAGSGVDTGIGIRRRSTFAFNVDGYTGAPQGACAAGDPSCYIAGLNPAGGGVTNITSLTAGNCTAP
jgi:hypothetical protein